MEEILEIKDITTKTPPAQSRGETQDQAAGVGQLFMDNIDRATSDKNTDIPEGVVPDPVTEYAVPMTHHSTLRKKKIDEYDQMREYQYILDDQM